MKEMIAMVLASVSLVSSSVEMPEMLPMKATAYILTGTTASGEQTRHGICATGRREWLGKNVIMYQRGPDGTNKAIGFFEIKDTGCAPAVIDVWCDGMEEAQEFMNRVYEDGCAGNVYIQLLDIEEKRQ